MGQRGVADAEAQDGEDFLTLPPLHKGNSLGSRRRSASPTRVLVSGPASSPSSRLRASNVCLAPLCVHMCEGGGMAAIHQRVCMIGVEEADLVIIFHHPDIIEPIMQHTRCSFDRYVTQMLHSFIMGALKGQRWHAQVSFMTAPVLHQGGPSFCYDYTHFVGCVKTPLRPRPLLLPGLHCLLVLPAASHLLGISVATRYNDGFLFPLGLDGHVGIARRSL